MNLEELESKDLNLKQFTKCKIERGQTEDNVITILKYNNYINPQKDYNFLNSFFLEINKITKEKVRVSIVYIKFGQKPGVKRGLHLGLKIKRQQPCFIQKKVSDLFLLQQSARLLRVVCIFYKKKRQQPWLRSAQQSCASSFFFKKKKRQQACFI